MMDIPVEPKILAKVIARVEKDISPVEDEDLVHLLDLLPIRSLLLSIVDRSKPLGGNGNVVEETESHRILRLGVMTWWSVEQDLSASASRSDARNGSPNDSEPVADLTLGDSTTHLDDSSARQARTPGRLGVDVEREAIEVLGATCEVVDGLICSRMS